MIKVPAVAFVWMFVVSTSSEIFTGLLSVTIGKT